METKYLISQNSAVHGFLISDIFDSETEAKVKLTEHKAEDPENEYDEEIHKVEVLEVKAEIESDPDCGEDTAKVSVEATVDNESASFTFYVQTTNGRYRRDLGCWITTGYGGDMEFDEGEMIVFAVCDIIDAAEALFED